MKDKRYIWVVECWTKGIFPKLKQPLYAFTTKTSAKNWEYICKKLDKTIRCKIVKYIPNLKGWVNGGISPYSARKKE